MDPTPSPVDDRPSPPSVPPPPPHSKLPPTTVSFESTLVFLHHRPIEWRDGDAFSESCPVVVMMMMMMVVAAVAAILVVRNRSPPWYRPDRDRRVDQRQRSPASSKPVVRCWTRVGLSPLPWVP